MNEVKDIIRKAVENKQKALSEYDSKRVVKLAGVPITNEIVAQSKDEAVEFAEKTGFPVVLSQRTVVSRWLVMPIASILTLGACRIVFRIEFLTLCHISSGSCSTHPGLGKYCRNS